ncbi:PREDICTED: beta-D-glucosyl crocetin beta-1,6-glucosyltransferase-like [Nelumbo nucifera]|uniref:Glycosyltransferase n=2 Tax=Nelumbo nucifera TaxID=4432 RepID=A0A823A0S1_NELNU|nr:PREDICTED: beta-D-glucosyl crocetin beta-1,6-glucosyltransferase-like [Nelumbo nucifera]DAD48636.1 TPA_asm: hypothetical protein HUJ06_018573 [Nelumbo nucifera]
MDTKPHCFTVLMLPWLAHGHISPFLEVGKRLSKRNFHVYFCSTPVNLCSIRDQLSEKIFPSIQLVEIHLPTLPGLPPHYHTTKGLPPHLMPTLKQAFDMAKPSFLNLLRTLKPDLLIYDFIQPWAPTLASSLDIPAVQFLITGGATSAFFYHICKNPGVKFPFPAIYLEKHEDRKITQLLESSANGLTDKVRLIQSIDQSSRFIMFKTFREIEEKYIDYYSVITGKEILPVGPLVLDTTQNEDNQQWESMEWLNKKDPCSVVFVSFGSEFFLSKAELEEMAYGLELSGVSFIWVVRFPEGEKMSLDEALPEGFLGKVGEKGIVVEGWAPQAQILDHSSIGGFVSHSGSGSVMEGMKFGVPLVAMPMHLDQPTNSRVVVELGVGVEVKREKDGSFLRGEAAKAIKEVVVEKQGEEVRRKARELSEKIREEEMDMVAEKLGELCSNSKRSEEEEIKVVAGKLGELCSNSKRKEKEMEVVAGKLGELCSNSKREEKEVEVVAAGKVGKLCSEMKVVAEKFGELRSNSKSEALVA